MGQGPRRALGATWRHSPPALASAELSWSANTGGHTVHPATLSLLPHLPREENPPPCTPLTDPQPPRQKPQHYLPRQANICNYKRERKNLPGLHTPKRGCKMRCLGAPFMYLLGFSSIRPLRCHESTPPPPHCWENSGTASTYLKITTVLTMDFSIFHCAGSGLHFCMFFSSYHGSRPAD